MSIGSRWRRRIAARGRRVAERLVDTMREGVNRRNATEAEVVFHGLARGTVPAGTTLLEAARALDVDLDHYCGGNCSCGTCRVEVLAGAEHLERMRPGESMVLGVEAVRAGDRLACQARVRGPVEVRVPAWFMVRGS